MCSTLAGALQENSEYSHKKIIFLHLDVSLVVDLNRPSLKRRGEFEDGDHSAAKLHRQGKNSCKAQIPKPPVGNLLSTALVPRTLLGKSPVSEQSPKSTDSQHWKGPVCDQSTRSEPSPKFKPTQLLCASPTLELCKQRQPAMGAKQVFIQCTQNETLRLLVPSPPKQDEESLEKRSMANDGGEKPRTLFSSGMPLDNSSSSPYHTGDHCTTSVPPVKTPSKSNQVENRKSDNVTPKPASKPNSGSQSCHKVKQKKSSLPKRRVSIADDIDSLFTPDPMTYVVSSTHETSRSKTDERVNRSSTSEKSCSSNTVTSSCMAVTGSSSGKRQNVQINSSHAGGTNISPVFSQLLQPFVNLKRVNVENLRPPQCKDKHKNRHSPSSSMQHKDSGVESEKHKSSNTVRACTLETTTTASEPSPAQSCNGRPVMGRQANEEGRQQEKEVDPLDEELDFGLSLALDMDLDQSSQSSEDEQLLSLQEMMELATKLPDTPEKGAFPEPGTPGPRSCKLKPVSSTWFLFTVFSAKFF